jgi:hypothetical protein
MIAPFVLLVVVVAYRVILGVAGIHEMQWLHNFSPVAAVALCGAVYLPRRAALLLPTAILLISDVLLNLAYHQPFFTWDILPRYAAIGLIAGLGFALRGRVRLPGLLGASAIGSFLFYVITNTGSWLSDPVYARTAAGWLQALTIGDKVAGYPPTWVFYQHTLVSDLLFTLLFALCFSWSRRRSEAVEGVAVAR